MRTLLFILLFPSLAIAERPLTAKIVKVIDGDTIKIETNIRLAEIDCPESKQDGGQNARAFLAELVEEKQVQVILHGRGVYGRFIGELRDKDGNSINEQLVRQGYCWKYKSSRTKRYTEYEAEARREKRGIWKEKEPQAPWDWRKERRKQ